MRHVEEIVIGLLMLAASIAYIVWPERTCSLCKGTGRHPFIHALPCSFCEGRRTL